MLRALRRNARTRALSVRCARLRRNAIAPPITAANSTPLDTANEAVSNGNVPQDTANQ